MIIDISYAQSIDGWMANEELNYLAQTANKSLNIAEIGSWKGKSTSALAGHTSGTVYAIDTWNGSEDDPTQQAMLKGKDKDWLYNEFLNNTKLFSNIVPLRTTSLGAAKHFSEIGLKFDLIFIDARHDFISVDADIQAWKPLLTENGIICGHDYTPYWAGVIHAVDKNISKFRTIFTLWTTEV